MATAMETPGAGKVKKIQFVINEGDFESGVMKLLGVIRPTWLEKDIGIMELTEGHLNKMVVATYPPGNLDKTAVIFRIPSRQMDKIFDREKEMVCLRLLNELDISAPYLLEFTNGLCLGYLPGETFTRDLPGAEVVYHKRRKISWAVAREITRYHCRATKARAISFGLPTKPKEFAMLRVMPEQLPKRSDFSSDEEALRYFKVICDNNDLAAELDWLESIVADMDVDIVFSHGDLVPPNVIYDEEKDKATFIDYEFAGFNYRPIDITNFFLASAALSFDPALHYVDDDFKREFIKEYLNELARLEGWECPPSNDEIEELKVQCDTFMLIAELRYVLFPAMMAKGAHAKHKDNFDYIGLAIGHYQQYKKTKVSFLKGRTSQ